MTARRPIAAISQVSGLQAELDGKLDSALPVTIGTPSPGPGYALNMSGQARFDGTFPIIIDPDNSHIIGTNGQMVGFGLDGHFEVYTGPFGQYLSTFRTIAGPDFSTRIGPNPGFVDPPAGTTLLVWDQRPLTGVSRSMVREGEAQGAAEVFGIYAADGTTRRLSFTNGNLNVGQTPDNPGFTLFVQGQTRINGSFPITINPSTSQITGVLNQYIGFSQLGAVEVNTVANQDIALTPDGTGHTTANALNVPVKALRGTPVSGDIENDGTHLYWTDAAGARHQLDV